MQAQAPARPPVSRAARSSHADRGGPPNVPAELTRQREMDWLAVVFWTCQALGAVILVLCLFYPGWFD